MIERKLGKVRRVRQSYHLYMHGISLYRIIKLGSLKFVKKKIEKNPLYFVMIR